MKRGLSRARAVVASTLGDLPGGLATARALLLSPAERELGLRRLTPAISRLRPLAERLDPVIAQLDQVLVRARPLLARLPFRPSGPVIFTAAAGFFVVVLVLLAPGTQVRGTGARETGVQGTPAASTPSPLASASFKVPPLSSYSAAFVSQAPYPTVAPNGQVEWAVALRNTGSAGWYRGVSGAQASLRLSDGTTAGVQTTPYVGPGQTGWFIVRFQAPGQPGTHAVTLRPSIDGGGLLRDLGIHVLVTVRR